MGLVRKLRIYQKLFSRGRSGPQDLQRLLGKQRTIMFGVAAYEFAMMASNRVDPRLKTLAAIKASSLIGCPF